MSFKLDDETAKNLIKVLKVCKKLGVSEVSLAGVDVKFDTVPEFTQNRKNNELPITFQTESPENFEVRQEADDIIKDDKELNKVERELLMISDASAYEEGLLSAEEEKAHHIGTEYSF